jgi:hypothetical protein
MLAEPLVSSAWTVVVQQGVRSTRYVARTAESLSVVTMSIAVRVRHMWPEGWHDNAAQQQLRDCRRAARFGHRSPLWNCWLVWLLFQLVFCLQPVVERVALFSSMLPVNLVYP